MAEHETDVTSLVFGLVFLGLAGLWGLVQLDVLAAPSASVAGPVVLVVAGLAGLLLTVRRAGRARRQQRLAGAAQDDAPDDSTEPAGTTSGTADQHRAP